MSGIFSTSSVTPAHRPWIDWFRFIAAFVVLLTHVRTAFLVDFGQLPIAQKTIPVAIFYGMTRLGNEAVIVFFVLSGYLVGGKGVERILSGTFDVSSYSKDRFFRIFVPFLPILVFTIFAGLICSEKITAGEIMAHTLGLQGVAVKTMAINAPLWSLAYEIWFYILFGAVGYIAALKQKCSQLKILPFVITAISLATFCILEPTYLFCWILGAIAYLLPRHQRHVVLTTVSTLGMIIFVAIIQIQTNTESLKIGKFAAMFPNEHISKFGLALTVAVIVSQLPRLLTAKTIMAIDNVGFHLAAFSYTMYLVHYPVVSILQSHFFVRQKTLSVESVGVILFAVLICLVVSIMFYYAFEKQTTKIKNYFKRPVEN